MGYSVSSKGSYPPFYHRNLFIMIGLTSRIRWSSQTLATLILVTLLFTPINVGVDHVSSKPPVLEPQLIQVNTLLSAIDMEDVDYEVVNTPDSFDGFTLFNLNQVNRTTGETSNSVIIMDMEGTIVAEKDLGRRGGSDCAAEFIDPNTVLVGTQTGVALWHLGNDTMQHLNVSGHHEYEYNSNNNTIFTLTRQSKEIGGIFYRFDYIHEYTMNKTLVWELDVSDFISENWWCPYHDMSGDHRDISHSNTIFYDAEEDIIYYNSRNTNTFFKIDHKTGNVIWGLGEYGDFDMYDIYGHPVNHLFFHAHSVEPINENTFILFDNNLHNQTYMTNQGSRMVEIEINETTMTAHEVWYYKAPRDYYSAGWGDADHLPNGNRIGNWGYPSMAMNGICAAFIEVNEAGKVVWKTTFRYNSDYIYGSYRLERFRFKPTLSSPGSITRLNQAGNITWQALYNYRNKEPMLGNYTLYIDDAVSLTGDFTYAKYWNPTNLTMPYGKLGLGPHNVTLSVSDGYGHVTTDTVMMTMKNFIVERTGYTTIEKNQTLHLPTWSGSTLGLLSGNLTLNGTLYTAFNWTGQTIVILPADTELGSHFVQFRLFNDTLLVYDDSFWLYVTPLEPPVITPLQSTYVTYEWGEDLVLSWDLYDATGHSWLLLVNGTVTVGDIWTPTTYQVDWEVPYLNPGVYNITLYVDDDIGQVTTSECWLSVPVPTQPYILSSPGDSTVDWGSYYVSFTWEVIGGTWWMIFRNGQLFADGPVFDMTIELKINDWREDDWRPGLYNLTLVLTLDELVATDTIFVNIIVDRGDPYADDFIPSRSQWYLNGENAIGAPDLKYTTLFPDYENGFITLDMGEDEEILNLSGSDFSVEAEGGNYSVYVSNSLNDQFQYVGFGSGHRHFDLLDAGLFEARYVRVQYLSGELVDLDAIIAIHYNTPPADYHVPEIEPIDDFSMWIIDHHTILNWSAYDDTPWRYRIYRNSVLDDEGVWTGSRILYYFAPESIGRYNITLVLSDAFDNWAFDSVMVDVLHPILKPAVLLVIGCTGVAVVVLLYVAIRLDDKKGLTSIPNSGNIPPTT